jgi:hypothetical protein
MKRELNIFFNEGGKTGSKETKVMLRSVIILYDLNPHISACSLSIGGSNIFHSAVKAARRVHVGINPTQETNPKPR